MTPSWIGRKRRISAGVGLAARAALLQSSRLAKRPATTRAFLISLTPFDEYGLPTAGRSRRWGFLYCRQPAQTGLKAKARKMVEVEKLEELSSGSHAPR